MAGGSSHRFRVFGDPSIKSSRRTSKSPPKPKNRVQFHGVEVREYARSLADNPSAEDGPPLGLDWGYKDMTRERNPLIQETNSNYSPCAVIPIDDYEKETERRRRAKLMQMCKLREQSMKQILGINQKKKRRSKNLFDERDDSGSSEHTLSEEQMKQLSAHWLKIQPLSAMERIKIILQHTDCTEAEITEHEKNMRKARMQRRSSAASAESGLDDWQSAIEFFKRRYRRYKSGISKQREQELLWEQADSYWMKVGRGSASSTVTASAISLRSSISSVSHY